jgi:hypothetical protein
MRPHTALVALAAAACLLAAAPAHGSSLVRTTLLDVEESGPKPATLGPVSGRVSAPLLADGFFRRPTLEVDCAGRTRSWVVGVRDERVAIDRLRIARSADLPLLMSWGNTGASGRVSNVRVHRVEPAAEAGACPTLVTLFRFPDRRTPMPRSPRGTSPGSFSVRPFAKGGRVWLRTYEGLYRRDDAGCCPSMARTIDWRPKADGTGYRRAKTRVSRLRRA